MMAKREEKAALKIPDKVEPFVYQWLAEVVEKTNKNPRNIRRVLKKDVIPAIGKKRLSEVTVAV